MSTFLFLVLCAACCVSLGQAQRLQCASLNVDNDGSPQPGSTLDICQTDDSQCCTQSYLNQVKREARANLRRGLRGELNNRLEEFNTIVGDVVEYLTGRFPSAFTNHIPNIDQFGDTLRGQIEQTIQNTLIPVFSGRVQDFNGTAFVDMVLSQFDSAAIQFLSGLTSGGLNEEQQMCVRQFIDGIIDTNFKSRIARGLNQVHLSIQAINRIANFLVTFNNRTAATYDVSEACVRRLIQLSFCGRCTGRLPPLCNGTCGALVRGCFAPFVTGLERAFNNLWNVTDQIVERIRTSVTELFMSEEQLLGGSTLIQLGLTISTECGLSFNLPGRKRRQSGSIDPADLLPESVMEEVRRLNRRGVFEYDDDGPEFCEPSDDREDFCRGNRGNSDDDEEEDCGATSVCTSSCQCWNGRMREEESRERFNATGIAGQDKNPVFTPDPKELEEVAITLGDPVNDFLTSEEFTTVVPEGVTVPEAAPYSAGRGFRVAVYSLGVLMMATLCALFAF